MTTSQPLAKHIEEHTPLVKRLAQSLYRSRQMPASVTRDDLESAGFEGLLDAIQKFDPERGVAFSCYARIRIKGAMLDMIRSLDWLPRTVRADAAQMAQARHQVEQTLGHTASQRELAEAMGCDTGQFHVLRLKVHQGMSSYEEMNTPPDTRDILEVLADPQATTPDHALERQELRQLLAEAISRLPKREQLLLHLSFREGMRFTAIGDILGVSESRVSQLRKRALKTLRNTISRRIAYDQAS